MFSREKIAWLTICQLFFAQNDDLSTYFTKYLPSPQFSALRPAESLISNIATKCGNFKSPANCRRTSFMLHNATWPNSEIVASDWSRVITWPGYWPLIGWEWPYDLETGLLSAEINLQDSFYLNSLCKGYFLN